MNFDPRVIRQSIENLKVSYPDLIEDEEAWIATLESETGFNEVLTSIIRRKRQTEGLVVGAKHELDEIRARKDRLEHRANTLRELAFKIMSAAEIAKVELPIATLSLRAGTQQLVGSADPEELPDELCRISRDLDRTAIKDALKNGGTVPGFQLSNGQPSISIRIK